MARGSCLPLSVSFRKGEARWDGLAFCELVPCLTLMSWRRNQKLNLTALERDGRRESEERVVLAPLNNLGHEWSRAQFCLPLPRVRDHKLNQILHPDSMGGPPLQFAPKAATGVPHSVWREERSPNASGP
jgi:hypothetical protein